jgi:hypothetical protein
MYKFPYSFIVPALGDGVVKPETSARPFCFLGTVYIPASIDTKHYFSVTKFYSQQIRFITADTKEVFIFRVKEKTKASTWRHFVFAVWLLVQLL